MELNNNQKMFCQEYVRNGSNGTQAYLKVYKTKKEETAKVNASRLLTKANISNYIKELQDKTEKKNILSIEERMRFLSDVVRGDETEDVVAEGGIIERKAFLNDRMKAIDILNKMDGQYTKNVNLTGNVGVSYENRLKEMTDKDEY